VSACKIPVRLAIKIRKDNPNNNNNNNNNNKLQIPHNRNTEHVELETKVTPVIIGATGTISKSFTKYLSSISGKHDIKELQKTAILGTAHILRKVLM
jgi:hypothetical protein